MTMQIEVKNTDASGRVCAVTQVDFRPGESSGETVRSNILLGANESTRLYIHAGSKVTITEDSRATVPRAPEGETLHREE